MSKNLGNLNDEKIKQYNFEDMPQAFLSENPQAQKLRKQLHVKNLVHEEMCNPERLSQLFFSDDNMDIINRQLVTEIFNRTKGQVKIPFQKKDALSIVMRWVYIHYSRNLPFDLTNQIRELNKKVLCELVPKLKSAAIQHINYLRDIEKPLEPLPPPINTNNNKVLPSFSEIYHS